MKNFLHNAFASLQKSSVKLGSNKRSQEEKAILCDPNTVQKVADWVTALGSSLNITTVEACAQTRIRIKLKDSSIIDKEALKREGVGAIIEIDDHIIHLLTGLNADQYAKEMSTHIAQ